MNVTGIVCLCVASLLVCRLIFTGEAKRGVIGLYQTGLQGEHSRGLSIRFRGIDDKGNASYLLSLYCSAAILADDAIAVLEDVEVGEYYDYDKA